MRQPMNQQDVAQQAAFVTSLIAALLTPSAMTRPGEPAEVVTKYREIRRLLAAPSPKQD